MAALALSATAVAFSGHTDPEKKLDPPTTYYYGNTGGGVYVQISAANAVPEEHCFDEDPNTCIVTSATNTSTFTLGVNAPGDLAPYPGSGPALYQ